MEEARQVSSCLICPSRAKPRLSWIEGMCIILVQHRKGGREGGREGGRKEETGKTYSVVFQEWNKLIASLQGPSCVNREPLTVRRPEKVTAI